MMHFQFTLAGIVCEFEAEKGRVYESLAAKYTNFTLVVREGEIFVEAPNNDSAQLYQVFRHNGVKTLGQLWEEDL